MTERDMLFKAIQQYDFALYELNLYLDTHPKCLKALEYFNKYNDLRRTAYNEYIKKYGPLVAKDNSSLSEWEWVDSPWPWERSEG